MLKFCTFVDKSYRIIKKFVELFKIVHDLCKIVYDYYAHLCTISFNCAQMYVRIRFVHNCTCIRTYVRTYVRTYISIARSCVHFLQLCIIVHECAQLYTSVVHKYIKSCTNLHSCIQFVGGGRWRSVEVRGGSVGGSPW